MIEYYTARSSPGGLLISEACPVSLLAASTPGIREPSSVLALDCTDDTLCSWYLYRRTGRRLEASDRCSTCERQLDRLPA